MAKSKANGGVGAQIHSYVASDISFAPMILVCILSNYKSNKTYFVPFTQSSLTLWDIARGNNNNKSKQFI